MTPQRDMERLLAGRDGKLPSRSTIVVKHQIEASIKFLVLQLNLGDTDDDIEESDQTWCIVRRSIDGNKNDWTILSINKPENQNLLNTTLSWEQVIEIFGRSGDLAGAEAIYKSVLAEIDKNIKAQTLAQAPTPNFAG